MPRLTSAPLLLVALALACGPGEPVTTDNDPTDATTGTDATGTDATATTTTTDATTTTTDATTTTTDATTQADPTGTPTTSDWPVECGDEIPTEGSPCLTEGEECAPDADPCLPFAGARCTDGLWVPFEVGPGDPARCERPVACDPEKLPPEGSPCETEGEFCSPGCQDPCQFCNLVECTGGVWQNLEAFPADCLDCASVCEFVVAAGCTGGPPDAATCVAGCEENEKGRCLLPHHQALACAGGKPTFTCDALDRPVVAGCEDQFEALYACSMP